jgi:UDP-3-O-[3-hydroxymyristoyl] glucosamine N-acyltransferase
MDELNVKTILKQMDFKYQLEEAGEMSGAINGVASIDMANKEHLSYCSLEGPDAVRSILKSNAGAIICSLNLKGLIFPKAESNQLLIFVDNPRLKFVQILQHINKEPRLEGITQSVIISKTAKIGSNCYIGNYTVIGDNCEVGNNTIIHDRVTIMRNSKIGKNCIIQPGVSIGADGFAFERKISYHLERFPHIGGVIIGDNVELSTNCSIARGSLSNTIIGNGTKLDAMVHVAHNVKIGTNCLLTAGAVVGGGTIIGDTCWIGLNSTLKHKIKIGNNVVVGCGASVIQDVLDEDVVAGVPAKSIKHKVTTNKLFLMAGQKTRKKRKKNITKIALSGFFSLALFISINLSGVLELILSI